MKNLSLYGTLLFILFLIQACGEEILPKPKAMLRLEYPKASYSNVDLNCPYVFEKNELSRVTKAKVNKSCWYNIEYDDLKATVYLSYFNIQNNLDSLLRDAQNITQEHTIKADAIQPKDFIFPEKKLYGRLYEVSGDAASPYQFYITDSTKHFIVGSAYFRAKPNYDSVLPAANYLKNDLIHFVESVRWKE